MTSEQELALVGLTSDADVTAGKAVAMSSENQFASGAGGKPPRAAADQPDCPQCQRKMTVKQISPVLFSAGVDDVVYGCESCGTETKRTIKRT
jgi:hypothetical protein